MAEFYQKHFRIKTDDGYTRPKFTDADRAFFNMVETIQKDGSDLDMAWNRERTADYDGYMASLMQTATYLKNGVTVYLASHNPKSFIDNLKRFFDIDVDVLDGVGGSALLSIRNRSESTNNGK